MKIVNILAVFVLSLLIFQSCDKSEQPVSGKEGGLIEVQSPSLNYVVGNQGPYTASMRVYQGDIKTTKVEMFKSFNSSRIDTLVLTKKKDGKISKKLLKTQLKSNSIFYGSIDVTGDQNSIQSFDFTFSQLRNGLIIENEVIPAVEVDSAIYSSYEIVKGFTINDVGDSLPKLEGEYQIGDNWEFVYMSTTSDDRIVEQNTTTKVTVATRFAGKYRFVEGVYYRIGVLTDNGSYWDPEILIESIDAITYKMNGVAAWPENVVYFQIDAENNITYPAEWAGVAQTINGQPLINCFDNPSDMTEVCGLPNANTVILDNATGKDVITMSYGYMTMSGTTGPRIFYQVMEKIVE